MYPQQHYRVRGGKPVRRWVLLFASMLAATLVLASVALTQPVVDGAADSYIVVLEEDVDQPSQVASGIEQRQDVEVGSVYSSALEGFSAEIPEKDLAAVRANPQVAYIERDRRVHVVAQTVPWGIRRIGADVSSARAGNGSGAVSGVNAYIIDTGIDERHPDLNVVNHVNFARDGKNYDCNGHGTHVAGTLAAEDNLIDVVGVAPGAQLTGVKVIGCSGSGSLSHVIDGIDWVTSHARKPAVTNISLGTGASNAFDSAVRKSVRRGIFYAVAAGNEHDKACKYSPARAGAGTNNGIVTTAATDSSNREARISNYGSCVDLWAPGVSILSTWRGGGTRTFSGTSLASPHVGGAAALFLSTHAQAAPAGVERRLKMDSTRTDTRSKNGALIRLVDASEY
jgi:subtilisin family serine protease